MKLVASQRRCINLPSVELFKKKCPKCGRIFYCKKDCASPTKDECSPNCPCDKCKPDVKCEVKKIFVYR
jgi:hypothetical protein